MCKRIAPPVLSLVSFRLVREDVADYAGPRTCSTPDDVRDVCNALFDLEHRCEEHFVLLTFTTKNTIISARDVSTGSLNASIVHPRELFRSAVADGAASVVVAHNHPSGDPTPSGADIQLTRRLCKAGDVLGIEVLDHVVIGAGEPFSLREAGLM